MAGTITNQLYFNRFSRISKEIKTIGKSVLLILFLFITNIPAQEPGQVSGILVEAKTGQPLWGASVYISSAGVGTMTETDGSYTLIVKKPGSYEVTAAMAGFKTIKENVVIKGGETLKKDFKMEDALESDALVVIGTRGEERTTFNSPVPIDVITEAEIQGSGLHEVAEILHRFIPSVNYPKPSITDGTDHVPPFTIRGLGSDQVLVLINGKRRHSTALIHVNSSIGRGSTSVDLNTIPVSSISRIEVLRDGAAAQYGSDAIAGIINIVLKDETAGEVSAKYQQSAESDGKTYQWSNSFGFKLPNEGTFNITTEFRDKGYTNRAVPGANLTVLDSKLNGQNVFRQGEASSRDFAVMGNSTLPVNETTNIYAVGNFSSRRSEAAGYYRFPSQSRTLVSAFPNGFLPLIAPNITDGYLTFGIKTMLSNWNLDLSTTYGSNRFEFNVENSINGSLGPTSQRSFFGGALGFNQSTTNFDLFQAFDIGLKNPLNAGFGAEFRMENFRIEKGEENSYIDGKYSDTMVYPDGVTRTRVYPAGAQVFPGFQPANETDKSRNSLAVYADLENKVLGNLLLGFALRYENFSDFGQTSNGKFSLRYEPLENLVLRSSVSSGFRAPSLAQSYFTSTATNTIQGVPFQIGTLSVEHPLAKALGAQPLKAEKSSHFSAGIATQQIKNLSLSVDYFYVKIVDRIVFSGNFTTANASSAIKQLLTKYQIGGARFFTNSIDTKTEGIDLVAKYNINMKESGLLMLSLGANLNRTEIVGNIKYPSQISATDTAKKIFFDQIEKARTETMQPRNTFNFSVNYQIDKFSVFLRASRYGSINVVFDSFDAGKNQDYAARTLVDLDLSYRFWSVLTLSAGGHNIFNVYPEKTQDKYLAAKPNDAIVYSPFSPFGFSGADYYLKVSYNLR